MKRIANKLNNYKQMTKEEKVELAKNMAKNVAIYTGIGVTGFVLGRKVVISKYSKEIDLLEEDMDILFGVSTSLNSIIDRQTVKIKECTDTIIENNEIIKDLEGKIEERDLAIMELVEGNVDRYRGIRCAIWSEEELLENADRLDAETLRARRKYDKMF